MNDVYKVTELEKGIWAISEKNVHMFLVEGSENAVLIDTGFGGGDLKTLTASLTKKPITVVLTHSDGDHVGGAEQFGEVFCHPSEFTGYNERAQKDRVKLRALWEGDVIDLGSLMLEVIHIPGHTPGSIALYDEDRKVLFSGDSIQTGPIHMFGPKRNLDALIASMEKLEDLDLNIVSIYACHYEICIDETYIKEVKNAAVKLREGKLEPYAPANDNLGYKEYKCGKVKLYSD